MASLKEHILNELKKAEGTWVSGEILRQSHNVSRMAISKQVRGLLQLGYDIETSTRKGYRLVHEPDLLHPAAVMPLLTGELFRSELYHFVEETKSTNDDIKTLAIDGAPEGTVMVAEAQKRGRGRRGRTWFSQQGNSILLSVLVRPQIDPRHWPMLPLMTAVAIREALQSAGIAGAKIKWPNDILVNGKKIAGILCEMSSEMDRLDYAVLGIGLNINTPPKAMPAEIRDLACSMYSLTRRKFHRAEVLAAMLRSLEAIYTRALEDGFETVRQTWIDENCTVGKRVHITDRERSIEGLATGIQESGALLVTDDHGREHIVFSGDLSFPDRD